MRLCCIVLISLILYYVANSKSNPPFPTLCKQARLFLFSIIIEYFISPGLKTLLIVISFPFFYHFRSINSYSSNNIAIFDFSFIFDCLSNGAFFK